MQRNDRHAAMPQTVREQIESLLSEPRPAKTSLGQALAERDRDATFDRCMVGGDSCKRTAIRAHCIPETALKLIADESRRVIAAHSAPPRTPVQWLREDPLKEMSISSFNAAKWACRPHDDTFGPLDTKRLEDFSDRSMFLLIYKITAYLTHRVLHIGERLAVPMLEPDSEIPRQLKHDTSAYLKDIARTGSFSAMRVWWIKLALDKMLHSGSHNRLDYRASMWKTRPAMAAVGMMLVDGPGTLNAWYGENSLIPVWVALLPQEHGQTIVTASPRGTAGSTHGIHQGVSRERGSLVTGDENWTKLISDKVLSSASDLAISEESYARLSAGERDTLQTFVANRSQYGARRPKLPNLLSAP